MCSRGTTVRVDAGALLLPRLAIDLKRRLVYPAALVWSVLSSVLLFVVQVSLWKYAKLGPDPQYTFSYFAVVALLRPFLSVRTDRRMQAQFSTGNIIYEASRPAGVMNLELAQDLSAALLSLLTVSLPTVAVIAIFFDVGWPPLQVLPVFVLSLLMAFGISWCMAFMIGCSVFRLKNNEGVLLLYLHLMPLLSGALVPLEAMPGHLRTILLALPFRALYDLPIRVFIGSSDMSVASLLLRQAVWLLVTSLGAWSFGRWSIKRLEFFGG